MPVNTSDLELPPGDERTAAALKALRCLDLLQHVLLLQSPLGRARRADLERFVQPNQGCSGCILTLPVPSSGGLAAPSAAGRRRFAALRGWETPGWAGGGRRDTASVREPSGESLCSLHSAPPYIMFHLRKMEGNPSLRNRGKESAGFVSPDLPNKRSMKRNEGVETVCPPTMIDRTPITGFIAG